MEPVKVIHPRPDRAEAKRHRRWQVERFCRWIRARLKDGTLIDGRDGWELGIRSAPGHEKIGLPW